MNELLTTFLPSILLMIITFATTSFKPFFFEAALSVNLTTMLMMTTISIGKMQTLPATAYVRMIDVWLVFCQLVPFAEVILLTAQEYYRDEEEPAGEGAGKNKAESEGLVHMVECGKPVALGESSILDADEAAAVGDQGVTFSPQKRAKLETIGAQKYYLRLIQEYHTKSLLFFYFREAD